MVPGLGNGHSKLQYSSGAQITGYFSHGLLLQCCRFCFVFQFITLVPYWGLVEGFCFKPYLKERENWHSSTKLIINGGQRD